jgi:oligoendopeptidase F
MHTEWNLKQLYKSTKDPKIKKDIESSKKAVEDFVKKWKDNNEYLDNPKVLKQALDEYERLNTDPGICDKPLYYFLLLNSLDQSDPKIKGELNKLNELSTKLLNKIQFFELNISKIEKEKQKKLLDSSNLRDYKHFLEGLFRSGKYLLSDNEEKVFNIMSKTSHSNWVNMISELLNKQEIEIVNEKGKKEEISYNEVSKYLNSRKKNVRDYASKNFNLVNEKYLEVAEFEINSILERKKASDEYRDVPRPDLLRHIDDDIESELVDTLIGVVSRNFNISKDYYKKKAEFLNQKILGYHERNVPLGKIDQKYEYMDSADLVKDTFKNLDPEFYDIVTDLEKYGNYDVFPKKNKQGGAFCITINKTLPTYVMLNHNSKLNDVLTIAHESGHAIHSTMSKKQNSLNCGYPTSLAEVASTFFEDFVLEEILKDADEELKFSILAEKLNGDISTIFRQVAFYSFELELHKEYRKRGYLTKDDISEIFCKHMQSYLGDSVKKDDGMKYGWIYWSHLRMFFYVYSYASGLLISKSLQSMVREDRGNIKLVKEFLRSGSTKSPTDLIRGMGIDIMEKEFWQRGIDEIEVLLEKFN